MALLDKFSALAKAAVAQGKNLLEEGTQHVARAADSIALREAIMRLANDFEPKETAALSPLAQSLKNRLGELQRRHRERLTKSQSVTGVDPGRLGSLAAGAVIGQLDLAAGELADDFLADEKLSDALLELESAGMVGAPSLVERILLYAHDYRKRGAKLNRQKERRSKEWRQFRTNFSSEADYSRLQDTTALEDAGKLISLYGGFIDEVYNISELRRRTKQKPVDPEDLLRLAEAQIARKSASLLLRVFLTVSNPFSLVPFALIMAYKRGKNIPDAEIAVAQLVLKALADQTGENFKRVLPSRRHVLRGRALLILGRHAEAVHALKHALLASNDRAEIYFYLAGALTALGESDAALGYYIAGIEAGDARCAAVLQRLAAEYRSAGGDFSLPTDLEARIKSLTSVPQSKADWRRVLSGFIDTKTEAIDSIMLRFERRLDKWLAL